MPGNATNACYQYHFRSRSTKRKSAGESTTGETTASLELESSASTTTLLEHESLTTSTATERRALERLSAVSARGVVGVVAAVETLSQLGIRQDLVCLVDGRHLLLGLLF